MVTKVEISEARLGDLVERAGQGEEVLITVNGKVKARLTAVEEPAPLARPFEGDKWWDELRALHRQFPVSGRPMQEILDELREDRI